MISNDILQRKTSTKANAEVTSSDLHQEKNSKPKVILSCLGHIAHVFYSFVPIFLYTCCLYIVAVSRESVGTLTITMGTMIHPIVAIPIGMTANTISAIAGSFVPAKMEKFLKKRSKYTIQCVSRLCTLTFNAYLSLVGAAMYYLFKSSVEYRKTSEYFLVALNDFKGLILNKCLCQSKSDGEHCINKDTNFQNLLSIIPNEILLLVFMIFPLICHVLHSFLKDAQPPITLYEFIVGKKMTEENVAIQTNQQTYQEMDQLNVMDESTPDNDAQTFKNKSHTKKTFYLTLGFQIFCLCLFGLYVCGIIFTPRFYFYLFEERERVAGKSN